MRSHHESGESVESIVGVKRIWRALDCGVLISRFPSFRIEPRRVSDSYASNNALHTTGERQRGKTEHVQGLIAKSSVCFVGGSVFRALTGTLLLQYRTMGLF